MFHTPVKSRTDMLAESPAKRVALSSPVLRTPAATPTPSAAQFRRRVSAAKLFANTCARARKNRGVFCARTCAVP